MGEPGSEISQLQKNKYCIFPLYTLSKVVKLIETENRLVVARRQKGVSGSHSVGTVTVI